jgi:hypothetical protein
MSTMGSHPLPPGGVSAGDSPSPRQKEGAYEAGSPATQGERHQCPLLSTLPGPMFHRSHQAWCIGQALVPRRLSTKQSIRLVGAELPREGW